VTTVKRKLVIKLVDQTKKAGVSFRQIERDTGIGLSNLSRISRGKQRPSFETIQALCNYFECTPGDLLKME